MRAVTGSSGLSLKMETCSNFQQAKKRLQSLREKHADRCSHQVILLWENFVRDRVNKLGSAEVWTVYEQVALAALDCNRKDISNDCFTRLAKQFPASERVKRLKAMVHETAGRETKALELYDSLLKDNPADSLSLKRKVALAVSQNKVPEAIKLLNDYLEMYMTDAEAWGELCDLYLNKADYEKAAYCMEEIILSNPHNHLHFQKYAEIKYSMAKFDQACSYYCQALKLNPSNIRSLYGLWLTCSKMASDKNLNSKSRGEYSSMVATAFENLSKAYKKILPNSTEIQSLDSMMTMLQLTQ